MHGTATCNIYQLPHRRPFNAEGVLEYHVYDNLTPYSITQLPLNCLYLAMLNPVLRIG